MNQININITCLKCNSTNVKSYEIRYQNKECVKLECLNCNQEEYKGIFDLGEGYLNFDVSIDFE